MPKLRVLVLLAAACLSVAATVPACGGDDGAEPRNAGGSSGQDGGGGSGNSGGSSGSSGSAGSAGSPMLPGPVCFLNNCDSDAECTDCSFGRNTCDTASNRCVACTPGSSMGCTGNQVCTSFGICAEAGQTCPTDGMGEPMISCSRDSDCAACDPAHQLCNTASGKCVACSPQDLSFCRGNEACSTDGKCELKCPTTCSSDADCTQCTSSSATTAVPAPACNKNTNKCSECSDTKPCAAGKACTPQGICVATCGQPDKPKGSCQTNQDCSGCGADNIACQLPINGGEGKCGVAANGCSDLGQGAFALPPPWNSVTNTCSDDGDCAGVGVNFNIGKELRDLTGLGFIKDATLQYGMHACASVTVGIPGVVEPKSCGICVPCKKDADCAPIQLDPLVDQMFGGLGGLAAKWALDQLFGDAPHTINMYCENVIGDYGVCIPCADPTSLCGVGSTIGQDCQNVWECATGEYCLNGKCEELGVSCFGIDPSPCSSGKVCGWNGDKYCCRQPATGSQTCTDDTQCSGGQVCSATSNPMAPWVCASKDSACQ